MVYALCFNSNTVFCFRSEREAAEYCRNHPGEWQLCDERGDALCPIGFTPTARVGLLAAHTWLTNLHDEGGMLQAVHTSLGLAVHGHQLG